MREDTPSSTALLIARATLLLSHERRYAPLVPAVAAEACEWFVQACDSSDRFAHLCCHRWFRTLMFAVEHRTLPGIVVHYALRKRALEETARQALAAGCQQAVILGAGFDTLALRLREEYPDVLFLEVDHPATQRVKRTVLESRGHLGSNLALLPLDIGQSDLEQALSSLPDYRPQSPTVFIAEGLLMYLPPERVAALFGVIRRQCGPLSRFVFTFLEPQPPRYADFQYPSRVIGPWLMRHQEPFRWGISRAALPEFLRPLVFDLDCVHTPKDLRRRFLAPGTAAGRSNGDLICIAAPHLI